MFTIADYPTVGELVVKHPELKPTLEEMGLDYCCGGAQPLTEALAELDISVDDATAKLQSALLASAPQSEPSRDWRAVGAKELVQHILDSHHQFMRKALPRISGLIAKVQGAHGERHGPLLKELRSVYESLKAEIEGHLLKEEEVLFPWIVEASEQQAAGKSAPPMHCGTVQSPIQQMEFEHTNAGAALERMRELTCDYNLPDDACPTFAALYNGLKEMEADLHEHIHLENNILFPKAVALEAGE